MLQKCREQGCQIPAETRKNIRLIQGDMTNFVTDEKYAMATIPFRPFQHLITIAEQKACLDCINTHLVKKGKLGVRCLPHILAAADWHKIFYGDGVGRALTLTNGRWLSVRTGRRLFITPSSIMILNSFFYVNYPTVKRKRLVHCLSDALFLPVMKLSIYCVLCGFEILEFMVISINPVSSDESPEMIFCSGKDWLNNDQTKRLSNWAIIIKKTKLGERIGFLPCIPPVWARFKP